MMKRIAFIFVLFLSASLFAKKSGVLLCPSGTVLYTDKGDGSVEAVLKVEEGTFVEVESSEPKFFTLVTQNNHTYYDIPFYKVIFDNKEYFVVNLQLAFGEKLSHVTENTTIFNKPRISAFSKYLIYENTLVVAGKTLKHAGHKFTEIQFFDVNSGFCIRTAYILSGKLKDYSEDREPDHKIDFATEK